jgi:hypothetical protein
MFKYKTDAEVQAMTEQEANDYAIAKRTHEADLQAKAIETALKPVQDELKTVKDENEQLSLKVSNIETKGGVSEDDFSSQLKSFLTENEAKIKSIHKSGSGAVEFVYKAVGTVTTASGVNTTPPTITGTQQAPLSNINLRDFDVTALTTNVNTSLAAYPYTEAKPKDGDYSFLAEGETKPQIDFSWETNYAKPVKAAAWIKLTDESVQDVVGLESVARDLLFKKHNIKKAKGILYGDGISPNPKGATTYGRVFSAGDMALKVVNPNFMDVVNAAITDIATTHNYEDEMPYMANLVLVNPIDFYIQMVSAKDLNGLPLYPQASLFNQVVIGSVTIKPEETIPAGKIFVCDMSKYNTTNYVPYSVKIGWVNDDFIKNQFVILAESRFHAFVKKLDEQAFIYDDIAIIKTAITKV